AILDELVTRGHEVTVLRSSFFLGFKNLPDIKFELFPTSFTKDYLEVFFHTIDQGLDICAKRYILDFCEEVVLNKKLVTKLQESRFDVILADAIGPCGELLAELLKIPLVYSLCFSSGYTIEKYSGGLPFPPSYVPVVIPTTLSDLLGKAKTWVIGTYGYFEFPWPLLTHFKFVGGFLCKPAKPLPMVLWRFDGHPKTKAFITHGGNNGIYEVIYHGIPMIGISWFAEQPDTFTLMKIKGADVRMDLSTISSTNLLNALKRVINDPS
ncbi:hypothetical protein HPG69_001435, partial [Diceros bicornis minor]